MPPRGNRALPSELAVHVVHMELWMLLFSDSRHARLDQTLLLSAVSFPPLFSAPHQRRSVRARACFSLLLKHETLTSCPHCASDADQQLFTWIKPFFCLQSLCFSPYRSWKQHDLCKWNSSLRRSLLPSEFLPSAAGSFLWNAGDRRKPFPH